MDAEDLSMTAADSPAPSTNPGTPQVSNPGTPRHDSELLLAAAAAAISSSGGVSASPIGGGGGSIVTGAVSSSTSSGHHHHHHGHHHSSSSSSHHGHHGHHHHLSSASLSSASLSSVALGSLSSHVSLLSHVSSPSVLSAIGPGMVPQGSSITQSLVSGAGGVTTRQQPQSKYAQLLAVIEDLGKDIRPTYAGSKSSAERLKRGIVHARILRPANKITPLASYDTQLSADSVEFCPTIDDRSILICGCYQQLQEEATNEVEPEAMSSSRKRLGCLHLLSACSEGPDDLHLDVLQRLDVPAVLDVKWCPQFLGQGKTVACIANANGEVSLYTLHDDHLSLSASELVGDDCIALSLDWSTVVHNSEEPLLAVSDSHGKVSILQVSSELRKTHFWKAHDHESWIVAFNYFNPSLLYSGGDDAKLKGWDLRQPVGHSTFVSSKHQMGVTSIQNNWSEENVLVTGSYDEHILMWDVRKMKSPVSDFSAGGGVWRLKFCPEDGNMLLAACMHNGVWLCDGAKGGHLTGVVSYQAHDSLAYGIDWCRKNASLPVGDAVIASCSFYDSSLHIWKCKLN